MIGASNRARYVAIDTTEGWVEHRGNCFRYPVVLSRHENGFAATSATIPPVAASGETEDEALEAVTAALANLLRDAIREHRLKPRSSNAPKNSKWVIVRL
jgi:predicted RNase H-like HicB family nuclease